MKLVSLFVVCVAFGLSACQSKPQSEEAIIDSVAAETQKQLDSQNEKQANPAKCQQAKIDLVEAEGSQDTARINLVKAAIMEYCDNIQ